MFSLAQKYCTTEITFIAYLIALGIWPFKCTRPVWKLHRCASSSRSHPTMNIWENSRKTMNPKLSKSERRLFCTYVEEMWEWKLGRKWRPKVQRPSRHHVICLKIYFLGQKMSKLQKWVVQALRSCCNH